MCLSGFDRLDTLFAKNRCTRSTPTGVRGIVHLSQVSSTLKTNKDLDPIYVLVFVIRVDLRKVIPMMHPCSFEW